MRAFVRSAWVCAALLAFLGAEDGVVSSADAQPTAQSANQQGDPAKRRAKSGRSGADMVITGDEEAPQVLTIIPWQEPRPKPPPEVGVVAAPAAPEARSASAPKGGAPASGSRVPSKAEKAAPTAPAVPAPSVSRTAVSTLPAVPIVLDSDLPIADDPLARPLPAR